MKITIMAPQRPKPQPGDRRTTKKHGLQIRTWDRAIDGSGRPYAYVVSYNRPRLSWTCPQDLAPWDRHYLTPEECAQFFPEVTA